MNVNLTRSQKAKANEFQKSILNVIAEQNSRIRNGEELFVYAETIAKMHDTKMYTFDEAISLITTTIYFDVLYKRLNKIFSDMLRIDTDNFVYEYNTSNLKIGMIVPNYIELCRLLEVTPKKGGKSRQLHERDFLRYFDYEKINFSNSYMILDIYDREDIIPKNSNTRNSLYINQLKILLLLLVSTQAKNKYGNKELKSTFPQLRKQMNIINANYDDIKDSDLYSKRKQEHILLSDKEAEYQKNLFKLHAEEKFKNSMRTALNSLEDDDLIHYETYTVICYYDDEDNKKYRQASPDEEMYIHNVKQDAANQLGYTLSLYASRFRQADFETIIRNRFKKEKKWHHIFNGLRIISNDNALSTPIKDFTVFKDINYSVYDVSKELQDKLRYDYNNNIVASLHTKIGKSIEDKEKKLLKWYKTTSKYKDMDDEDLLLMYIPQHDDMRHFTKNCNDYRHYLVDLLIKLDNRQ